MLNQKQTAPNSSTSQKPFGSTEKEMGSNEPEPVAAAGGMPAMPTSDPRPSNGEPMCLSMPARSMLHISTISPLCSQNIPDAILRPSTSSHYSHSPSWNSTGGNRFNSSFMALSSSMIGRNYYSSYVHVLITNLPELYYSILFSHLMDKT